MKPLFFLFAILLRAFIGYSQTAPASSRVLAEGENVKVEYSQPSGRGRSILGKMQEYGMVWRAGPNEATHITFKKDGTFGGKPLKAGTYTLFIIPNEKEWTIILNSELKQWGAVKYDEIKGKDVLQITVPVKNLDKVVEKLTYRFSVDSMIVEWDKSQVFVLVNTTDGTVTKGPNYSLQQKVVLFRSNVALKLSEFCLMYSEDSKRNIPQKGELVYDSNYCSRITKKFYDWPPINAFEPELLTIPKLGHFSTLEDFIDTVPRKRTGIKGGGERTDTEQKSPVTPSGATSIRGGNFPGPSDLQIRSALANRNSAFLKYCGKSVQLSIGELPNSSANDYLITIRDTNKIKHFFPESELVQNEYNVIREFTKSKDIVCYNLNLRVGVAVRIRVRVFDKPETSNINTLEHIAAAVDMLGLQAYYYISIIGIPDEKFFPLTGIFNIDGYKKAYESANDILKDIKAKNLNIDPQILVGTKIQK